MNNNTQQKPFSSVLRGVLGSSSQGNFFGVEQVDLGNGIVIPVPLHMMSHPLMLKFLEGAYELAQKDREKLMQLVSGESQVGFAHPYSIRAFSGDSVDVFSDNVARAVASSNTDGGKIENPTVFGSVTIGFSPTAVAAWAPATLDVSLLPGEAEIEIDGKKIGVVPISAFKREGHSTDDRFYTYVFPKAKACASGKRVKLDVKLRAAAAVVPSSLFGMFNGVEIISR